MDSIKFGVFTAALKTAKQILPKSNAVLETFAGKRQATGGHLPLTFLTQAGENETKMGRRINYLNEQSTIVSTCQ